MTSNRVHPTAIIGPGVEMDGGNIVGPYAVILGPCVIGEENWIGPHVVVGTPGEMRGLPHPVAWEGELDSKRIEIGHRNIIRELTTIQQPTQARTSIGSDGYYMDKTHIAHDCAVGDQVTMAPGTVLAGHVTIEDHATLGINVSLHQRVVIGRGAMIGMGSVVTKSVPPLATAFGNPATVRSANVVGMSRAGVAEATIRAIDEAFRAGRAPEEIPELHDALALLWANSTDGKSHR
jgi:UDP-N-acetylglucosamine acyltransferase